MAQVQGGKRASLYVDGFNLYYSLRELNAPHLKWLGLWQLGEIICQDRQHDLVSVTYCTAFQTDDPEKTARHRKYIDALKHFGVETILGHYVKAPIDPCRNCGIGGEKANEKQSDINLALSVFSDAMNNKFDFAYILSADSDQAATARFLRDHFPSKGVITVSPPNKAISDKIASYANGKRKLNALDISKARMPSVIIRDPAEPIRCPRDYDVP